MVLVVIGCGAVQVGSFRLVQTINVCTIFVISGLLLSTADLQAAIKAYVGFVYGLVAILFITPCLGFLMYKIPFQTREYAVGLTVFSCVPTTLTSGVTYVMQAGGNAALALMLTVCSNILGILTTPFALSFIVSQGKENVKLDTVSLLVKLALSMLVPLLIGKTVRESVPPVKKIVTKYSQWFTFVSNFSLILIVWQTLSRSQEKIMKESILSILEVIGAGVGLHLVYLLWNYGAIKVLRLKRKEQIAVLILASQKTLPVSVTVISLLKDELGNDGLITIPCVISHMAQLFVDAYVISRWTAASPVKSPEEARLLKEDEDENETLDSRREDSVEHKDGI